MAQKSTWNILEALSAFKSRRLRDANHEHAMRELKRFPSHLLADCQGEMDLPLLRGATRPKRIRIVESPVAHKAGPLAVPRPA
ncbi:hypothetical protein Rleg4DRAFT_1297 [Rhizobium leguminosarum bv. trifolii WSM2297]|uniref:Uncharacterized protein n=1 Tax=Rhizobium leguminosarum bv. trifolii WSM2297 TaxID=754762 RepID=J0KQE4_RHILT|nr:hypothetical protein [Rhizobium leguminosarum]EJC79699.1 hypothetical protein Rleg4DRAFT_1297 [Rhizobium leguminosarum bv. trifolii WSM2297]